MYFFYFYHDSNYENTKKEATMVAKRLKQSLKLNGL